MLTIEQNKELVDKYPFLWPRYLNNDDFGQKWEPYNYEYTELGKQAREYWIKIGLTDVVI